VAVADINSRLERLSRRDELTRRARQRTAPDWVTSVGDDVMEVVEAAAAVIRRHPGMSVMLAPADGRPGSAVIRISERNGEVEVAPVNVAVNGGPPPAARAEPVQIPASAPTTVLPISAPTPVPAGAPVGLAAGPGDDAGYDRTQPQPTFLPPQPGYAPEPYTRAHHTRHSHAADSRLPAGPQPGQPGRPGGQHAYPPDGQYPPYQGADPGNDGYEPYPGGEAPPQFVQAQPQYDPPQPESSAPPEGERTLRPGWRQAAPDQPQYHAPVENWHWER
jgi:hypothetical protein